MPYLPSPALLTDLYQLTMAQGYWKTGLAVREAFAWGDTLVHRDRTTGEDNAVMIMRFEDGRAATMDVSWSSKGGLEGRFEVAGTGGRLLRSRNQGEVRKRAGTRFVATSSRSGMMRATKGATTELGSE